MKPSAFAESNVVYAKEQKPYLPLAAFKGDDGMVISCWKCETWREWFRMLFTGRIWLLTLTFNKPLQPSKLGTTNPFKK